ncbi:MAG: phage baseplate assembly protein V [Muribaculum sp.]|nr:phage baseplate assembly protein V [Muribaculum sp.]
MSYEDLVCGASGCGEAGIWPTYDVWGVVMKASDDTGTGNVRVQVKTMRSERDVFDNVPVLTCYGGADYGFFALPEEGDVVRVTFLGGDFCHPAVTGCRFPADSVFVQTMCGQQGPAKGWKTKHKSLVAFSGEEEKEKIEISGPKHLCWALEEEKQQIVFGDKEHKNEICVNKEKGESTVTAEKKIRLECGKSSLELKEDGTVVLNCGKLTLQADTVQIEGKRKIRIKGQDLSIEGAAGMTMSAKGQIKVESKAALKLSGAMIHLN